MITTPSHFSKTIRSNSFAARLTAEQRDELYDLLDGGLSYREAGEKVRAWIKANDEAGLNSKRAAREFRLTDATTIRRWYKGTTVQRRFAVAQEAAVVALAYCPETFKSQTWRALDQARYLASFENLSVSDIAKLERNEILRQKLAFQREKYDMESAYEHLYELQRLWKEGHNGPNQIRLINSLIEYIEQMRKTRDYQS